MTVPHAPDAERAVLGAMLLSAEAIADAMAMLRTEDFYDIGHRRIFDACCDLWRTGARPDATLIGHHLHTQGFGDDEMRAVVSLQAGAVSSNCVPHARIVAEYATRRRSMMLADELRRAMVDETADIGEALDRAKAELELARVPSMVTVADVVQTEDFASTPDSPLSWVIPGLLDEQDRTIIVAPEGAGKSVVSRWLAVSTAQGLHPFTFEPIPPATTLIVDLENPARIVRKTIRNMLGALRHFRGEHYDPARCWIWHRPGGIDLRSRAGKAELDAVCARVRPRLVCLGPLYKAYRADSSRREHDVASEVAASFDELRTRHGFALVLEHHAPLKQGGVRELRPFGTLLWSQWPEVGLTLAPTDETMRTLAVGFYRGSRDERHWPVSLTRGTQWPWDATYADDRWRSP